jgi:broad specificity phosphatase PhoE
VNLLLVRHGQCLGQNSDSSSTTPDSALTQLGEWQARRTAQRIANLGATHILSSPLIRALSTACAISEASGNQKVEVWTDLREIHVGIHRGYGRSELQRCYPRADLPATISENGWCHGDESIQAIHARCRHVAQLVAERFASNDCVVMVTHAGFSSYLLHTVLGMPFTTPCWFEMHNCAISHLHFVPKYRRTTWPFYPPVAVEILSINDSSHLRSSQG